MRQIENWMIEESHFIGTKHPTIKEYVIGDVDGIKFKAQCLMSKEPNLVKLKIGKLKSEWFTLGVPEPYYGSTEWI